MNEGLEAATATPQVTERRRGFRLLVVLALLVLAFGAWLWMSAPYHDPRLVGEWQSNSGTVRIFHADGRLEVLMLPARTPAWPGGPRWWRTEGDELVTGTQTTKSRLKKWFANLRSSWTRVQVVGLNDFRYKIVELTATTLQLRLIRIQAGSQRPVEVFHRASVEQSERQSQSALAP